MLIDYCWRKIGEAMWRRITPETSCAFAPQDTCAALNYTSLDKQLIGVIVSALNLEFDTHTIDDREVQQINERSRKWSAYWRIAPFVNIAKIMMLHLIYNTLNALL